MRKSHFHLLSTHLRDSLCNFGLHDLACNIDFAYFLCVARLSCAYTKTTIRLTISFIFFEFLRIFGSPKRVDEVFHQLASQMYLKPSEIKKKSI